MGFVMFFSGMTVAYFAAVSRYYGRGRCIDELPSMWLHAPVTVWNKSNVVKIADSAVLNSKP